MPGLLSRNAAWTRLPRYQDCVPRAGFELPGTQLTLSSRERRGAGRLRSPVPSADDADSGVLLPRPSPSCGPPEVVPSAGMGAGTRLSFHTPFLAAESRPSGRTGVRMSSGPVQFLCGLSGAEPTL